MKTDTPPWDLIAAFAAVMGHGSLSAAARALGTAQPTVRRQVGELEAALGCVLFTRSKAGLRPTQAALDLLPFAESMAASADGLVRMASGSGDMVQGSVRISCSEAIGGHALPAILAELGRVHPGLAFELSLTDRNEDLIRGDADLAVRMQRPTQDAVVARRACRVAVGLFASDAYLAHHPAPSLPEDLRSGHRLVGEDRGTAFVEGLQRAGVAIERRDLAFRSDNAAAQLAAIRAGAGIGACQLPLAGLGPSALHRVLPSLSITLDVWVATHEDLRHVPRVHAVFDALVVGLAAYAGSS